MPANLAEARKGFRTKLVPQRGDKEPVEDPPAGVFRLVKYDAPVGQLPAYLTPDPRDGKKHPAIVWITGYDCNTINDVWSAADREDDDTGSAYRKAGIVMMFPSLRGGNDNPGAKEGFLGEVDDVLAAADFLAKQPYVDPARIYLGGHDTGGTLVLLVAECSDRFRARVLVRPGGRRGQVQGRPRVAPVRHVLPARAAVAVAGLLARLDQVPGVRVRGRGRRGGGHIDCLRSMARSTRNPYVQLTRSGGRTTAPSSTRSTGGSPRRSSGTTGGDEPAFSEGKLSHRIGR